MAIIRIRVDFNEVSGSYMAIKDYGDDLGYLEEIGTGATPSEAIYDLLSQGVTYDNAAYRR